VTVHPTVPWLVADRPILGPLNILADLRGQLALAAGILRNWRRLRAAEVIVVEGGLLLLTLIVRPFRRKSSPMFVFDLITLMSSLHRDLGDKCTLQCKLRRRIWRAFELISVRFSDLSVAGSDEDARALYKGVAVVPHVIFASPGLDGSREDPNLLGFLGSGHVVPNREALDFIASHVLTYPGFETVRCRVIGQQEGYRRNERLEFVGFQKDPAQALQEVSVGCAPMDGAGGVSTKVLAYLANGKRTVCTPEAAHGIARPPMGLWVSDRDTFVRAVGEAKAFPWSSRDSYALRDWMQKHHGLPALQDAWAKVLSILDPSRRRASPE